MSMSTRFAIVLVALTFAATSARSDTIYVANNGVDATTCPVVGIGFTCGGKENPPFDLVRGRDGAARRHGPRGSRGLR